MLISNLRSKYLQDQLKATMALEAVTASEAVGGNMHMDIRVIRVDDFNSEVK